MSQGSVETSFRWGGKHYNYVVKIYLGIWIPLIMKIDQFLTEKSTCNKHRGIYFLSGKVRENEFCKVVGTL